MSELYDGLIDGCNSKLAMGAILINRMIKTKNNIANGVYDSNIIDYDKLRPDIKNKLNIMFPDMATENTKVKCYYMVDELTCDGRFHYYTAKHSAVQNKNEAGLRKVYTIYNISEEFKNTSNGGHIELLASSDKYYVHFADLTNFGDALDLAEFIKSIYVYYGILEDNWLKEENFYNIIFPNLTITLTSMILNSNKEMFIKAYEMISNSYSYNDFKNPYTIGLAPKNIEEDISMNNLIKISVEALMKKFHNTNIIIPLTEEQIYDTIVEYIEDLGILTDFTIWYSTEGD